MVLSTKAETVAPAEKNRNVSTYDFRQEVAAATANPASIARRNTSRSVESVAARASPPDPMPKKLRRPSTRSPAFLRMPSRSARPW